MHYAFIKLYGTKYLNPLPVRFCVYCNEKGAITE